MNMVIIEYKINPIDECFSTRGPQHDELKWFNLGQNKNEKVKRTRNQDILIHFLQSWRNKLPN